MTQQGSDVGHKVGAQHLARTAFVYVRQSTNHQVRNHLESQRRQYDLVGQILDLGWPSERIVVVDEDQGKSGASAGTRAGFGRLVAAVGRSEAGIVYCLEMSRLARNNVDWHQLVYLCRWTGTLIADETGIYDPSLSTDRMVLGIRGQVSEIELDNSIHRMVEARWNKARRGELIITPPAGYEIDDQGLLVMTSDEAVSNAIRLVFSKFDEFGAARQVLIWWREQGLQFPVRRIVSRKHPIAWITPTARVMYTTLHHPIYAGAYVHGRAKTVREVDTEGDMQVRKHMRRVTREEWPVLIKDHHPAYISYDTFLQNLQRLEANRVMRPNQDQSEQGPAREGRALLQGLARCGQCGRRMRVGYGGEKAKRTLQYRCFGTRDQQMGKECQLLGAERIERAVVDAFLRACEHAGEEAALLVQEQSQQQGEDVERAWRLQIEKAEYEAQRAERQYSAVEPENRIVARELERRWNARMEELDVVRAKAREARAQHPALTNEELAMALALGGDLQAVWSAPTTEARDRKRLLRTLIEEVQLRTEPKRHLVRIVWKGGATTDRDIVRLRGGQLKATSEDTIDLVRKLAVDLDDAQIARTLNRQGRRSGLGRAFTRVGVHSMRQRNQIPGHSHRVAKNPSEGPFTAQEAAEQLGVAHQTILDWLRDGMLAGEQPTPGAPWRIVLSDDTRRRVAGGDAPPGWVTLTAAAQRLGMSKSHVVYLVKTGKLPAIRTKVGRRSCWKIDVSTAERGPQRDLFEQSTTEGSGGT